jgi:hypothetical protein
MGQKKVIKRSTERLVFSKIESALAEIEPGINKKKFEKKLRKASKILATDISKAVQKSIAKQQSQAKKAKEQVLKNIKQSEAQDKVNIQPLNDGTVADTVSR